MLDGAWLRHGSGDVDCRWKRFDVCSRSDLVYGVDAILQADYSCLRREKRSKLAGGGAVICGFHTEQNQIDSADGAQIRRCFDLNSLPKAQRIQEQTVILDGFHERLAANHNQLGTGVCP